jgi:DNA-binding GntR family transcriptional regulator
MPDTVDPLSATPVYTQIARILAERIERVLRDQGLVVTVVGRGSYVL